MDTFTKTIIILSIIFLFYYYYKQYKNWKDEQDKLTWPNEYNQCPDYWVNEGNHICKNVKNLGRCPLNDKGQLHKNGNIDFKLVSGIPNNTDINKLDDTMNSNTSLMKKCKWSKQCNSSWEGVDKLCA